MPELLLAAMTLASMAAGVAVVKIVTAAFERSTLNQRHALEALAMEQMNQTDRFLRHIAANDRVGGEPLEVARERLKLAGQEQTLRAEIHREQVKRAQLINPMED